MTTTTDFAKYLSRFFSEYLPHERNVSTNTIASYRDTFVQFVWYMRDVKRIPLEKFTLKSFTRQNVLGFLSWILECRQCKPATRNYRLAALHSFCSYLQYNAVDMMDQWQQILSIPNMETEVQPLNYLTTDGLKLLFEQPDTSTWMGRRHLAILTLMFDTGARVQEICDLTVDDVRITSKPYTIHLFGKGRKGRVVPLMEEQVEILRAYMEENHLNDASCMHTPLFFNNRHHKLSRKGVSYILSKYAVMARKESAELIPERLSCHSMRHSRGMSLLQSGVNLVYIRDILGHASIKTTDVYARADSKAKREALEKAYEKVHPDIKKEANWERDKDLLDWLKNLGK